MSLRILIVDDTKFLRLMLTDILTKSGYEVVGQAENGLIGVEMYRDLRPDLVIMDITMPEMDGITALKEIRGINPHSVILICSAMSQRDLISKALKAGANQYVMKPFEPERVNEVIDEVMPLIRNSQELVRKEQEDREAAERKAAMVDQAVLETRNQQEERLFTRSAERQETEAIHSSQADQHYSVRQDSSVDQPSRASVVDQTGDGLHRTGVQQSESGHKFELDVEQTLLAGNEEAKPAAEEEFGSLLEQQPKLENPAAAAFGEDQRTEAETFLPRFGDGNVRIEHEASYEDASDWAKPLTSEELQQLLASVEENAVGASTISMSMDELHTEPLAAELELSTVQAEAASGIYAATIGGENSAPLASGKSSDKQVHGDQEEWLAVETRMHPTNGGTDQRLNEQQTLQLFSSEEAYHDDEETELMTASSQAAATMMEPLIESRSANPARMNSTVDHGGRSAQDFIHESKDEHYARGMNMTASVQTASNQERSFTNDPLRINQELELELKRKKMRNVESSIMCKWNDQLDNQDVNYSVIYNEFDGTIRIDMMTGDDQKESIQLSMDGFSFLIGWLEMKGVKIEKYI